jgi:hypothetical protein
MMIIQAKNDKAEQEEELILCEAMIGEIEADLAAKQSE